MGLSQILQAGESVKTTWRELFTIHLLHFGYESINENFLSKGIRIVPYSSTQQLFTNQKIRYRHFTNALVCFIASKPLNPPADEPKVPFIPISGDLHIRFL